MSRFSERSPRDSKFKWGVKDLWRSYVANAAWPFFAIKGEADDPARGNPFFRSYGTRVSKTAPDDVTEFDGAGRILPGINFHPLGTFALPVIATGQVVNGRQVAPANPLRSRLLLRMTGPQNVVIFLSNQEPVSTFDYRIDIGENEDAWYYSQSDVFAVATKAGTVLFLAEEISV